MFRALRLLAKKPTPAPAKAKSAAPARLALEALEDRAVPATFTVTSLGDAPTVTEGELRWAIDLANRTPGRDTIVFQPGLTGTIALVGEGLKITEAIDLQGPGARNLTIKGYAEDPARVHEDERSIFNFHLPRRADPTNRISDITIADGRGSGLTVGSTSTLNLHRVAVKNNQALGDGGGIRNHGRLNVFDSTFTGNRAAYPYVTSSGGPVYGGSSTTYSFQGGAIHSLGTLNISNSTFADNEANGGIDPRIGRSKGPTVGSVAGGAIFSSGVATIDNSTFYANRAPASAVFAERGTMTIRSTIIANTLGLFEGGVDLSRTDKAELLVQDSLIGSHRGTFALGSANNIIGEDPQLRPLQNNGGPTDTLMPGGFLNPGRDKGSNPNGLPTDQTGQPRTRGGLVDIGAVEATFGRVGFKVVGKVTPASPPTTYLFTLAYAGVDPATLDAADVTVFGPAGRLSAVLVSVVPEADGTTLAATYAVVPPGGVWDATDNGAYTIELNDGQVIDAEGNALVAQPLGEFEVAFDAICDPADDPNTCFVKKLYADLLGRAADAQGLAGYKALLDAGASRASVVENIANSDESARYQIASLYQSVLGRGPDEAGLAGYQQRVRGGATYEDIAVELLSSAEFLRRYPNAADFATTLYALFLERLPDQQGLAAYTELFNTRGAGAVARAIIESPEADDYTLRGLYRQTLLRDATAEELLRDGPRFRGQTKAKLLASLLATDEYFALRK